MQPVEVDALVVGSGFGAAAPALRLTEAGYRVAVVEKGPDLDPDRDLKQTQDPRYIRTYLKSLQGDRLGITYAEALGGGSAFYEMVSLRAPSRAFSQTDRRGRRLWPSGLARTGLDPYYDRAEQMLHVEQIAAEEIPRSGLVFALLLKNLGYSCERARYAVRGCVGSGYCVTGCVFGAKQSLHVNYLPAARAAGCQFMCGLEAVSVRPLGDTGGPLEPGPLQRSPLRYEVACRSVDMPAHSRLFRARAVFLAGGTVGTAALLLRSRPFLPALSRHVGRNIAYNGSVKVAGLLGDHIPDGDMFTGRSHPGVVSYEFLESDGIVLTSAKPLPLQAVAAARLQLDGDDGSGQWWGREHGELMRQFRRRVLVLVAFGLTPSGGVLRLDPAGKPQLRLSIDGEVERYYERARSLLRSLFERNGCRPLVTDFVDTKGQLRPKPYFSTTHATGSCRMADDVRDGVVDAKGEVFGYPGLYVSDGAAIPGSLAVNSSLTILANAERTASLFLERHPAREPPVVLVGTERSGRGG